MTRKNTTAAITTTAAIGVAVGAAAYMMSGNRNMRSRTKQLRKNTGKALRQVGSFIDNVSYMMR